MSSAIATIEGIDLSELVPEQSFGELVQEQQLGGWPGKKGQKWQPGLSGVSDDFVYLPAPAPQPITLDEEADHASSEAKEADKTLEARRAVICKMGDLTRQAVARVEKLDGEIQISPAGPRKDTLVRKRAAAYVIGLRAAKTQAVAAVLARDAKRKGNLLRAKSRAIKSGDKREASVLTAAVEMVVGHENNLKALRAVQQVKWACDNAPLKQNAIKAKLKVMKAQLAKLDAEAEKLGKGRNTVENKARDILDVLPGVGFGSAMSAATAKLKIYSLDSRQKRLDARRSEMRRWIAIAEARYKKADRPCRNVRATPARRAYSAGGALRVAIRGTGFGILPSAVIKAAADPTKFHGDALKAEIAKTKGAARTADKALDATREKLKAKARAAKQRVTQAAEAVPDEKNGAPVEEEKKKGKGLLIGLLAAGGAAAAYFIL